MSRFRECDDDSPEAILSAGRWQHNARAALKGKRGRKALAELREALLALPGKRLIEGALCTVGGEDRIPEVTDEDIDQRIARIREAGLWDESRDTRDKVAGWLHSDRQEEREAVAAATAGQGCGVCVNGALVWYRKVRDGMDPEEAFASLPSIADDEYSDTLDETAGYASKEAGLTYTLAWELGFRNDERYRDKTPEERYTAFLAWIDAELATEGASS